MNRTTSGSDSIPQANAPFRSRFLQLLVPWVPWAAIVVPPVFFAVILVLGAVTPGYDAISRFASDLSLGPLGGIMIANFIVLGLVEAAFGLVFWSVVGARRSGRLGAAVIFIIGLAFLDAGVFVTDPYGKLATVHGAFHFAAAVTLFFITVPIGGFALAWRYRAERAFAIYSALTGLATPCLFIATFLSGDKLGLMERIVIGVILAWLTILALRVLRFNQSVGSATNLRSESGV